jgi:cyclohexa-1,5-dienecarbonyl-CoA hydratase
MTSPHLHVDRPTAENRRATLTLDRPPLHVLDLDLLAALDEATAELAGGSAQVVVVRSTGTKAFSAGVAVEDHVPERIETMLATFHRALDRLRDMPATTVAAVGGHCLGGGMELAMACDLVVADEGARFAQPEIKLGCYPPWAAAFYPERLGRGRTLDLLLTGRTLTAAEAESWGVVHRLVPAGELDAAVEGLVGELLAQSATVARLTRRAVDAGGDLAESERIYIDELAATHDMAEGLAAFLEKRPPVWRGK